MNKLRLGKFFDELPKRHKVKIIHFTDFKPNPNYKSVVEGVKIFNEEKCDEMIAVGGGSSIDVAKCIKLFSNMNPEKNFLMQEILPNKINFLAIPTTAGSGSEATQFAVIYHEGKKYSVENENYSYNPPSSEEIFRSDEDLLLEALMHKNGIEFMVDRLQGGQIDAITALQLPTKVKCRLIEYIKNNDTPKLERIGKVAFDFFNMREAVMNANADNIIAWKAEVLKLLKPSLEKYDEWDKDTLLLILSSEYARRVREFEPIYLGLIENIL